VKNNERTADVKSFLVSEKTRLRQCEGCSTAERPARTKSAPFDTTRVFWLFAKLAVFVFNAFQSIAPQHTGADVIG